MFLHRLVRKITGFDRKKIKQLYQSSSEEVLEFLKGGEFPKRDAFKCYEMYNRICKRTDRFSELLESKEGDLKGKVSYAGKVRGKVSIILNATQLRRFKKGDILVAPFTNVNYLPIMSKAKAILTETGGMTSHAAIISRELKKPCIVGINDLITSLAG